jgi:hypothetical protein
VLLIRGGSHKRRNSLTWCYYNRGEYNCPDVRNTRVIDKYQELKNFDIQVDVYDPWANPEEFMHEYGVTVVNELPMADSRDVSLELSDSPPFSVVSQLICFVHVRQ